MPSSTGQRHISVAIKAFSSLSLMAELPPAPELGMRACPPPCFASPAAAVNSAVPGKSTACP